MGRRYGHSWISNSLGSKYLCSVFVLFFLYVLTHPGYMGSYSADLGLRHYCLCPQSTSESSSTDLGRVDS